MPAFPPRLEAAFEFAHAEARGRYLALCAVWFSASYGMFLVLDAHLVPDVFVLAVILRLGVVVPFGFAVAFLARFGGDPVLREASSAALTLVATVTLLVVYLASGSPGAIHYHYAVALPVVFGNVIQRPRFRYALATSAAAVVAHAAAMLAGPLPTAIGVAAIVDVVGLTLFSLLATFHMEREARRAHLRSLEIRLTADRLSNRNDELVQLSLIDTMTGLANRRRLDEHLVRMGEASARDEALLAVLMIDVDHFKGFNDRYGHLQGDRCLVAVATTVRAQVRRQDDLVGRFGGEEFLVILPRTDLAGAVGVGERIRAAIEGLAIEHRASEAAAVVTVSIGIAAGRADGAMERDGLLEAADAALYTAKRGGRNRVEPGPGSPEVAVWSGEAPTAPRGGDMAA